MKNPLSFIIGLLLAFGVGVIAGAGGLAKLATAEEKKLRRQIEAREDRIDSLRIVTRVLTDSLQNAHTTTVIETTKYYEIKPKSYTVPALDSFFLSRYK